MDAAEERTRKRLCQMHLEQPVEHVEVERADGETTKPVVADLLFERCVGARHPPREQEPDCALAEAPGRVLEGLGGRPVEPLDVVDGDQERGGCKGTEGAEDRRSDGAPLGGRPRIADEEGGLERLPLTRWQRGENRVQETVEQIGEAGEREAGLGLGGTRDQRPKPAFAGGLHRRMPDGRLPHARIALEDQPGRQPVPGVEKRGDLRQLPLAPDHLRRHALPASILARQSGFGDTRLVGFTVFQPHELEFVPRGDDDPRSIAGLSDALSRSRANIWRYPPGSKGRRHADPVQEEVFVVLDGTLTIDLGDPPERHEVPRGGLVVVETGTPLQLRNAGDVELRLFIYGAPPERSAADYLPSID